MISRAYSSPRLVALYPQKEEREDKIQVLPPGFHVFYLPFADDIRQIDRTIETRSIKSILKRLKIYFITKFYFILENQNIVDLFTKCINKLKFKYAPVNFNNPALQKLWFEIEAIALAREETEQVEDLTLPDNDRIETRAGHYLREIITELNLPEKSFQAKTKRKVE